MTHASLLGERRFSTGVSRDDLRAFGATIAQKMRAEDVGRATVEVEEDERGFILRVRAAAEPSAGAFVTHDSFTPDQIEGMVIRSGLARAGRGRV